jgi:hypothetical protein
MKSISFTVNNAEQEKMLLQFAREHNIELESENELGFVVSESLSKEFEAKTGYQLEDYQRLILEEEQGEYLIIIDFKQNQSKWKKDKGL